MSIFIYKYIFVVTLNTGKTYINEWFQSKRGTTHTPHELIDDTTSQAKPSTTWIHSAKLSHIYPWCGPTINRIIWHLFPRHVFFHLITEISPIHIGIRKHHLAQQYRQKLLYLGYGIRPFVQIVQYLIVKPHFP